MPTININLNLTLDAALLGELKTVAPGLAVATVPATVTTAGEVGASSTPATAPGEWPFAARAGDLTTSVSEADIYDAINSDPRYSWRSMDAICKQLSEVEPATVMAKVREMVESGDLLTRDRRSGETVYSEN